MRPAPATERWPSRRPSFACSRRASLQLARAGWPAETDPDLLWLKPHLARLRAKVETAGGPQVIAVRGVGYRIAVEETRSGEAEARPGKGARPG
ncbi:MAG: helix-turn-helix domain-containing protein [Candidatus Limnocylindrales bacterium]